MLYWTINNTSIWLFHFLPRKNLLFENLFKFLSPWNETKKYIKVYLVNQCIIKTIKVDQIKDITTWLK